MNSPSQKLAFFAPAPLNMEDLLEKEILLQGGTIDRIHRTGIGFSGTLESAYRLCLWARVASRVLLPLFQFTSSGPDDLYGQALELPWPDHLAETGSFALEAATRGEVFTDNRYASLKLKDAIVDSFRKASGIRPEINTETPDVRFNLNIRDREVTISLDLSGDSLHKRGYRAGTGPAPLKENVAAGVLLRAGWPEIAAGGGALLDPMCGSGTFLIEAALMAGDIAPGLYRNHFGFTRWKGHDSELWDSLVREARERETLGRQNIPPIRGWDRDPGVITIAWENIRKAGLDRYVHVEKGDLTGFNPPEKLKTPGLVAVNPPYGKRLESEKVLEPLYRELGEILKTRFPGWTGVIITGSEILSRAVGMKPDRVNTFFNGPISCTVSRYTLFSREARQSLEEKERILTPGAEMFANRIRKNLKIRRKWARKQGISSYRLYDADMPEYAVALDLYEDTWAYVQEYAPDESKVDPQKARQHRREILSALPAVLDLPPKNIFFKTREKQKGSSQYVRLDTRGEKSIIREGGLKFLVNFTDYLDPGIFLDHRVTRGLIREMAGGTRFLNLFAYTGSATVYAAAGGAKETATVDASTTYLGWAEENMKLNGFSGKNHRYIKADCLKFLDESLEKWDLIFLDPPTFSNSKSRNEAFDIQSGHPELLKLTLARLAPGGTLVFSNNYRKFRMDDSALKDWSITEISEKTVPEDFTRRKSIHRCWIIRKTGEG